MPSNPRTLLTASSRRVVQHGGRVIRRAQGSLEVRTLEAHGTNAVAVKSAITRTLAVGSAGQEERAWVERIEAQRMAMLTSVEPLSFEDFGAGAGGAGTQADIAEEPRVVQTTLGDMTRLSSSKPRWGYLLFRLVRELKPQVVVELGTCVGISAAYMAAALRMNGSGRLITLEGGQALAERSTKTLSALGLGDLVEVVRGPFSETLDSVVASAGAIDLAFIDGHHQADPTLQYTEALSPALSPDAVLLYDDIHWSGGMEAAWARLCNDERFGLALDLGGLGVTALRDRMPDAEEADSGGRSVARVHFA